MQYMLALALGRSLQELRQTITVKEFFGWMSFYRLNPWGEERQDARIAQLASVCANGLLKGKFKPKDFMFDFIRCNVKQTVDEMYAVFKLFARQQNKIVAKGKKRGAN